MSTFLSGGSIVGTAGVERADVLITGNSIVAVGLDLPVPESARTIDISGMVVLPGLVDIHAHLREPGNDCLLYTSPSPRDQRGSRMPSSA